MIYKPVATLVFGLQIQAGLPRLSRDSGGSTILINFIILLFILTNFTFLVTIPNYINKNKMNEFIFSHLNRYTNGKTFLVLVSLAIPVSSVIHCDLHHFSKMSSLD